MELRLLKLMDEFLALAFHNERQLPVTVVRLFNTVGPSKPAATAWCCRAS